MPDTIKISELDEALALADAAEFPYSQENGGERTTFKAPLTQIAAKIVEDMSFAGIDLPAGAGVKSVENTLNYLLDSVGGDPNGNISDSYDPTAAYVKGDLCIYENALYICTAPTTGTFDPSKWTATTIDNVIGDLSTLTTTDKSSLVGAVNEVNTSISNNGFTTFTNGEYKRMTNGCVMLYLNGATHQQDLPIPLPDKSYYFTGLNQSNAVCGFFINTSGKLSIINSSTNTAVYATVVYST